jgi:hypothetical protein
VVLLLAATVLSACSPIPGSQLAIRRADGGIEFVFALCRGERVSDFFIRERDGENIRKWHASGGPDAPALSSVRLFEPVNGWIMADESLKELEPGVAYDAIMYVGSRRSDIRSVTLEAIESLEDGEVVGRGEHGGTATQMSDYDFHEAAARSCDG